METEKLGHLLIFAGYQLTSIVHRNAFIDHTVLEILRVFGHIVHYSFIARWAD